MGRIILSSPACSLHLPHPWQSRFTRSLRMRLGSGLTTPPQHVRWSCSPTSPRYSPWTAMPNVKTGQELPCMICGKMVYRTRAYLARGHRKHTCGAAFCVSESMRGENNPFWGKIHDEETRVRIRAGRRNNPPKGKTGPPKGYRHTPEARAKIKAALQRRWLESRDKMLAALPRGLDHHYHKEPVQRRHRKHFSALQRREWTAEKCLWCGSTERLNLDHIIPIFDGGTNDRCNAQTLCHPCNLWKSNFVDKPRYLAGLGSKGGQT